MSIEELKEKARLTDEEIDALHIEIDEKISLGKISITPQRGLWGRILTANREMVKAQQDKDFKTFLKWCKENNIYQVVEGELPETRIDELEYGDATCYDFRWGVSCSKKDMLKWHKQSLKEVRF